MTKKTTRRTDPSSPVESPSGQESIDKRAWSARRQVRAAAFAALVVVGVIMFIWFGAARFRSKPVQGAEGPQSAPGTFRATDQQIKTLTIETVATHGFVSEELTEGKIAVNGDRTPLQRQLEQARDQLAALMGQLPANLKLASLDLSAMQLPPDLPIGVPSQLVERRPDVRAAEAQLHAATVQVGVATANLGISATATGDLFKAGTGFWSVGATLSQTLIAGGTLVHRKRAADAAMDQAGAIYQSTVLTAFQNVADALHAIETDADAIRAASRSEAATHLSFDVARRQPDLGAVSSLALISAEQSYQQAVVALIQARANRYADTAALPEALPEAARRRWRPAVSTIVRLR